MQRPLVIIKRLSSDDVWEDYVPGMLSGYLTLPQDYTIKGYLQTKILLGQPVCVKHIVEGETLLKGKFVTSPVTQIFNGGFRTINSVYSIQYLK